MAKDIAWKTLKSLVPKQWLRSKNESDLKIELINGSMIELKGTENAMALRGRSLSGVVLDEAAFMDSGVWFEVLPRTRRQTGLGVIHLHARGHRLVVL